MTLYGVTPSGFDCSCKVPKNLEINLRHWHKMTRLQRQPETDRILVDVNCYLLCLQCFDAVGWAAGRASGL